MTDKRSEANFANFSNVFSSYTDGSIITLSGTQLARKEIRHSDAEIRIFFDGDDKNEAINSNRPGNFSKVSSGFI